MVFNIQDIIILSRCIINYNIIYLHARGLDEHCPDTVFLNIKKKSKKGIPPKFTLMGPDYYLVGEH